MSYVECDYIAINVDILYVNASISIPVGLYIILDMKSHKTNKCVVITNNQDINVNDCCFSAENESTHEESDRM
jgi:hypothetical protein